MIEELASEHAAYAKIELTGQVNELSQIPDRRILILTLFQY